MVAKALIKSKKYDHTRISRFLYFLKQFLYIRGKAQVVANLVNAGKFTISEIANFSNVPEAFVRKVKRGLKK